MFDFYCPHCRRTQLMFPGQVLQLINDETGISVILRCWCGELGAIRTGKTKQPTQEQTAGFELAS